MNTLDLSRRHFLVGAATAGAGLSLGFSISSPTLANIKPDEINAWVVIHPDNTTVIRIARSEMGQGTLTGLAQLVAEELDCDWDTVTWEYPSPRENLARDRVWKSFATGGSRGVRESNQYVREGGAAARLMLIEAAAETWGVDTETCTTSAGAVKHPATGRSVTYGEVATAAASKVPPAEIKLKDPADWKIAGKPLPRLDTADKVNGKQLYGSDLQFPGMLNASIKACPVHRGSLKSFNGKAAEAMPGVKSVMAVGDAVAVIADTWWRANKALKTVEIEWDYGEGEGVDSAAVDAMLVEGLTAETNLIGNQAGEADAVLDAADNVIDVTYSYPSLNHATMEPMNATALVTDDFCEVWCPTQNGEAAHAAAAEAAGLPLEQTEVHKLLLGGGFGRRGAPDFVTQAVTIAKAYKGTHVKLLWSREEDMVQGLYHPITKARVRGSLNADGQLEAMHMRISGQSIIAGLMPQRLRDGMDPVVFQALAPSGDHAISYSIPNLLVDHAMRNPHIRPGFWRGVNVNPNAIYMECFIDEMAQAAGADPLVFRKQLMKENPQGLAVLQAVADAADWNNRGDRALGLAVCYAFGSYVAACAEVSTDEQGRIKMEHIVAATDPGHVVNPQQVEAQVDGSFVYGLSALLYGECTLKDGKIEQENFDTYQSLRLAQMPSVETIVMPSGGFWGGVGEPTIAVAAPAVLNAIYAATGKRYRDVPLKNSDLVFA